MKKVTYIFFLLSFFAGYDTLAQLEECGCTNCPLFLPDGDSDTLLLNITGVINDDLANPNQGVCGVRLNFAHEWVGDLTLTLISPIGQEIQLIGPPGSYGRSDNSFYNITFVPCSEPTASDYPSNWNSEDMTGTDTNFTGTFWPVENPVLSNNVIECLEDFDLGPVNGSWKIFVKDNFSIDAGTFIDYEIILCDPAGITECNSNPCGVFAFLEGDGNICEGSEEEILLDASSSTGDIFIWNAQDGGSIDGPTDGPIVKVLSPGTYHLTVTESGVNSMNCEETTSFVVPPFISKPEVGITPTGELSCDNSEITITSQSNIPNGQSVEIWTKNGDQENRDTIENLIVSEPGVYQLTVIDDATGCSASETLIVEDDATYPDATAEVDGIISCTNMEVLISPNTNTNQVEYNWEGPQNFNSQDSVISATEPGDYTLTVTNISNGCSEETTVQVTQDTIKPSFTITEASTQDCSSTMTNLSFVTEDTFASFEWSGPDGYVNTTDEKPTIEIAGEYTLVATLENGCTSAETIEIIHSAFLPNISTGGNGVITCNNQDFELSGGSVTPGATFEWNGPNGFNTTEPTPGLVSEPGQYVLTVLGVNGCSINSSVTIDIDTTPPILTIEIPETLACLRNTTNLISNTQEAELVYEWSGPNNQYYTSAEPEIVGPGIYNLTITDMNGCQNNYDVEVSSIDTPPEIDVSIDPADFITCINTEVEIINTISNADYTYAWLGPNGYSSINPAPRLSESGIYTLVVMDSDGCSEDTIVEVKNNLNRPDINFKADLITCEKDTASIEVNANNNTFEYNWSSINGYSSSDQNPIDITQEGLYNLMVTDPINGCDSIYEVDIVADRILPMITISPSDAGEITCTNPTIALAGNLNGLNENSISFIWSTSNGNIASGENTLTPIVDAAGDYQLEVLNLLNGCINADTTTVTLDNTIPLSTLSNPETLNCNVLFDTINILANTDNVDIVWSLNNNPIPNVNTSELVIDEPGEYSVVLTSLENGCTNINTISVSQNIIAPIINAGEGFELQCNISEYQLQAAVDENENFQILWDTENGNITQGINSTSPTVSEAGVYTLEVLDTANGCSSTDEVLITVNQNIPTELDYIIQSPFCMDDLGSINITNITGGEAPYLYAIESESSFTEITEYLDLVSGAYQISAIDSNGCKIVQEAIINAAVDISVDLQDEIEILIGENISLVPNLGNIAPQDILAIEWSPATGLSCSDCLNPITNSSSDVLYTLEVTLNNGCSAIDQLQLRIDRDLSVYVPNVFSPFNEDGKNDVFFLFSKENAVANINTFAIYDRWGNQLFLKKNIQANDSTEGWDGIYKQEKLPVGVYIYYIEVEYINGYREVLKGNVTLMN